MSEFESMVGIVLTNLNNVFLPEDKKEDVTISKSRLDETFFTAELLALKIQYCNLVGADMDLIDFIGVLNKLAFQYLISDKPEVTP